MTPTPLSDLDWQLLEALQQNGRSTISQLAAAFGVSRSTVTEHLARLQDRGIVRHFTIDIDPQRLGFGVSAFVRLGAASSRHREIVAAVQSVPEIAECHVLTGKDLLMMRVHARDVAHLRAVVDHLTRFGDTQTDVIFAPIKTGLKVDGALRDKLRH